MKGPARLAVLASGSGTNLQALLDHFNATRSPLARVELVIGSRLGIGALDRSARAGVASHVVDPTDADPTTLAGSFLTSLRRHRIDLIVLAGFVRLVPIAVVEEFRGRMINIHPALLPAFGGKGMYGQRVHTAVLEAGVSVTGATVHLVDERYDEGGILAQWPVPVLPGDTPESLAARVLRVEHLLLPATVEMLVDEHDPDRDPLNLSFELADATRPTVGSIRRLLHRKI